MSDEPTVVEEWQVTGEPGGAYPSYAFTWRSNDNRWPGDLAEREARRFVATLTRLTDGKLMSRWPDGPHLRHRTVTYTPWEPAQV